MGHSTTPPTWVSPNAIRAERSEQETDSEKYQPVTQQTNHGLLQTLTQ
ncbi:hypothetical protein Pan153_24830 [Gimesia panareensis]|uniref:Uncharacterized protein n=1 Tax=Gimesia panareensis TaxID=2527978 RepID=A0A518FNC5_9PLAN|nr:hypothetical protein Pan153_24830 [Gimesia panareensis]